MSWNRFERAVMVITALAGLLQILDIASRMMF
jgi:hypothetical protein